uniref:ATP synthase subunit a, chloroplastic n=1 Tax=Mallomonas splendens TaxID=52552 RepID=A0A3G2QZE6_9STRA|nr:ATP synthase CF0 A subunit [Mallomonas splendens]AYO28510.1 ATP synthase CF0 A subunit [Mallomonas splendens]
MYTFFLANIDVGSHLYVNLTENLHFHGETVIVSTLVLFAVILFLLIGTSNLQRVPGTLQNIIETIYETIKSVAITQMGPSYYSQFLPFIATIFLFVLGCNWAGALIPWKLIEIPEGELAAPTNDINTTACLAILTSLTYFGAGFKIKGIGYFARYIKPTPLLLPINIIEDFTKPLSLNFRLFGNVVADELTVTVIASVVPLFIPVPIMILGLFASTIQALIFATLASAYIGEVIE